jgi:hypothetical protein
MHWRSGAQGRSRTTDTRIFSPLLYQLSYLGAAARRFNKGTGFRLSSAFTDRPRPNLSEIAGTGIR